MPDTEYRRLIQAAKDKALFGFLAVVQRAIQDADRNVVGLLSEAKSGLDHSALTAVRHFLRQDGNVFLRRADGLYRTYLERAMQTMYTDLRPGMRKLSADELSLIDDEAVNQQIEVGRLAQRMREANEELVGRLNVIVANLHGQVEAKERENPFRPYLLARVVYEAIRETAADEAKEKILYEHLATALIPHLSGFFSAIQEVFESSGVRGKFIAQRSRAAHHQRYFGAPMAEGAIGTFSAASAALTNNVMPGLNRLFQTLQQAPEAADKDQPQSVQNFIRSMFSPGRKAGALQGQQAAEGSSALVGQLADYQKKAARGEPVDPALEPGKNQLGALRERLELDQASVKERMTVEVVTMLFEIILEDEQIPAALRNHIARLQIPTLKAALLEPVLMHDDRHPARRLLNRMSSASIGTDSDSPSGLKLGTEMERVVRKVLDGFETDSAVFSNALYEFETFLGDYLRDDDPATAAAIEAVESAEKYSVLLTNSTRTLCDVLLPLNVDKRVSDFIITVWPHVLVKAAWQDAQKGGTLLEQCQAVLPELVWSIQDKANAQERSVLIKLLPDLVRRLRAAMQLIQLPDDESKPMLDLLVAMHTQILRGANRPAADLPSLESLRQEFARVAISWGRASWGLSEPPQVRDAVIDDVFSRAGVQVEQNLIGNTAATAADREFLAQTYLLGTRVELRHGGQGRPAQLAWISTHRSLYLFRADDGRLIMYSAAALLEALGAQDIVPLEYAPVFERAVESLLLGADKLAENA